MNKTLAPELLGGGGGSFFSLKRGDCFKQLELLADGSVDAFITDPPYGTMNAAWDRKLDLLAWWNLIKRKLKPTGVVVCFAAGRFLFELHASNSKWYRYDLVWKKSKAVGFLNASHSPLRSHEFILLFAPKWKAATYNPQKVPSGKTATMRRHRRPAQRRSTLYRGHAGGFTWIEDGTRHPTSVLAFDSVSNADSEHPTQKPIDLVRWLVRSFTNPGDLVCDPFMGSGTTAEACVIEGRQFFGCEKDPEYFASALRRSRRHLAA